MKTYTVQVERGDDRWWALFCPEITLFTQCRALDGIYDEVAPIIAEVEGIPETDIKLDIDYRLPADYLAAIETAQAAKAEAEQAKARAASSTKEAAQSLLAAGISLRDAGRIMGISHQRVAQIVNS